MNTPIIDSVITHYKARGKVIGKERQSIFRKQNRRRYKEANTKKYKAKQKSEFCLILKQTVEVFHCHDKRKGVQ